jgi:hypothetical protein
MHFLFGPAKGHNGFVEFLIEPNTIQVLRVRDPTYRKIDLSVVKTGSTRVVEVTLGVKRSRRISMVYSIDPEVDEAIRLMCPKHPDVHICWDEIGSTLIVDAQWQGLQYFKLLGSIIYVVPQS